MKTAWLAAGMVVLTHGAWAADRIPDLSMSPQEMLQQGLNVNRGAVGGTASTGPVGSSNPMPNFDHIAPVVGAPSGLPGTNYMDGYCDPNFKPMMAKSPQYAGIATCLEQQRNQACQLYQSVPGDVKKALDDSINCLAQANADMENAAGNDDSGAAAYTTPAKHCGATDTRRLALVKRYWNDQNLSYALVFVPDLVMDSSGSCLQRR